MGKLVGGADGARVRAVRRMRLAGALAAAALACTAHAAPGDNVQGAWSPVIPWKLIPVHAVLLPDGRVMSYGTDGTGRQTGYFVYEVWDPAFGTGLDAHTSLPNTVSTDIFCGSQVVLPGTMSVVLAGGDNWTGTGTTNTGNNKSTVFDGTTNTLTSGPLMNRSRWYSSSTTLLNGDTYIQGGSGGEDRPEIRRSASGSFELLSTADTSGLDFMYPRNFIAPDGRVFGYDSAGRMYYVDPAGTGSITRVGSFTGPTGNDSSAAMFRPGRILQFGGNSNGAVIIDINSGTPLVTTTASMAQQRRLVNATILADGKVLATGGSSVWNQATNVEYRAEIWDPATGQWTLGRAQQRMRLYHSIGLLLPDASVLVGGGGAPGPENNLNAEIYYPPYLFDSNGVRAARPQITGAPRAFGIGQTLKVSYSSTTPIARVTLVRTGSATHSWNMSQRFVEAPFKTYGGELAVQAPSRAADAPPGWYLLFLIDANGVPSVADIVSIGVAANPNPLVVPTLAQPADQTTELGQAVTLGLVAGDPNGDTLGYAASGLPPGLSIDAATGAITGSPTAAGSYDVVVAASDGFNSTTQRFLWTVTAPTAPLSLAPLAATTPALAGASVSFTAAASNGTGVRYSWWFGEGTPTAPSSSGTASYTFTRPGVYVVSVTATDSRGQSVTRSTVQLVHLPPTANRPTASSPIAFEPRGSGRVWVVNPDGNSVAVLDAATRTRLTEIAVGASPRSVAFAPNGLAWVVNRAGDSISVIDPATLTVARTVALPRASQPYGLAFAPTGGAAFVALEALGQVLRIDPSTYATTGTATVGPNPRQLSVAADGTSVYVSRFVTPPLPGESTATVVPGTRGGEIVVLSAASLAVQRTIVLAVDLDPTMTRESEAWGRGVPNYLGAAVISPDGTQAFVPSKKDNVLRGGRRDGNALNFQNTVRAISSRLDLAAGGAEELGARIDHDDASLASAVAFDRLGVYLFVALETSRRVAVVDAHGGYEVARIDVGLAPQGLAVSDDGATLYVQNFMSRTVQAFDLAPLATEAVPRPPLLGTIPTVGVERLSAQVLRGKQLFYDAADDRLARDDYMSCASCHNDGGHDGRVWDLTSQGEGLRNTASLRGRAGSQGFLHWSGNFDEVQDFEGQIRTLAGGKGLIGDAAYFVGTRSQPLGDRKAGVSADLDALAAYVASLNAFEASPLRTSTGALTAAAVAGRDVFVAQNCAACHAGAAFTGSGEATLVDVGTRKATSGTRLGGALTGIDPPTLRDAWATAPYLHDGSAGTLRDAILAHTGVPSIATLGEPALANLVAYVAQIGGQEAAAPARAGTGTGLRGQYFNNATPSGTAVLTRTESIDFDWKSSPAKGVNRDGFSVRWTGFVEAPATGTYQLQTVSDAGIRVTVDGAPRIANWTAHAATTDTSATFNLVAGQRYPVVVEFYEDTGKALASLAWRTPGNPSFAIVPADRLYGP